MNKPANRRQRVRREEAERYYAAYGCERDPFSDEGISGLFFPGGEREKTVQELLHFTRFTQSPLLLQGKSGAGKTSVLQQLPGRADKDIEIALVEAEIMQSDRQLMESVLRSFRQPVPEQVDLVQVFALWVESQNARQRFVMLCFDDAHNLTAEFLQPFFELVARQGSLFRLVLSGEQEIKPVLQALASQFEFSLNVLELAPFSESNVKGYAAYRLQAAGFNGDLPFTEIQLRAAQRRSNGNVNQLNSLLRDMLIAGSDYHKQINFKYPLVNLSVAAGILVVILIALLNTGPEDTVDIEGEELELSLGQSEPASDNSELQQPVESVNRLANTPAHIALATHDALRESPADEESLADTQHSGSEAPSANLKPQASQEPSADLRSSADRRPSAYREPLTEANQDAVADKQPSTDQKPPVEMAPAPGKKVAAAPEESSTQQKSTTSQQEAVRDRLRSWPETGYALQVFGTHNAQRARKLVEQYFGEADLLFYETRHNGKPWFVVISGPYSGRQAAQSSVASLPDSLQRLRPWPRNVASIRADIERFQSLGSSGG